VVTEKPVVTMYFCSMDPSVQFLLGVDVPTPEGATIHSLAPPPVPIDDDKIGFTLDVAMRLDQEMAFEDVPGDNVISINEHLPEDLADSA
jgi:hypothetical protein